jgi:hypothetical protein
VTAYDTAILAETALLSYWKLDETSGTAATDAKGSITSTYTSGFTLAGEGPEGPLALSGDSAVAFNGSTGYVAVAADARFNGLTAFTVEGVVNLTGSNPSKHENLWSAFNSGNSGIRCGVYAKRNATGNYFGFWDSTNLWRESLVSLVRNSWNHIAVAISALNATFYVNGANIRTVAAASNVPSTLTVQQLGWSSSGTEFLTGKVSHVATYNAALGDAAIAAHAAALQHHRRMVAA